MAVCGWRLGLSGALTSQGKPGVPGSEEKTVDKKRQDSLKGRKKHALASPWSDSQSPTSH